MNAVPELMAFIEVSNLWISLIFVGIGILGLYYGAEFLVRGSSRLALAFGVKPLVIGLTLVAFGTSTPELMVSLVSSFGKTSANGLEASLGNAVGSNIANIALILGATALIMPISVKRRTLNVEFPFMIMFTAVFWLLAFIGYGLNFVDGIILLSCFLIFILYCIITRKSTDDDIPEDKNILKNIIFSVLGLVFLGIGGTTLVEGGYFIMYHKFGISPEIIGLTLFAFGTSLPELVTSIIAQLRGHTEISVGNILGSNIFNLALVMGLMALIVGIVQPSVTISEPSEIDKIVNTGSLKKLSKLDSGKETSGKDTGELNVSNNESTKTTKEIHLNKIPSDTNTLSWNFSVMMFFSLLIVVLLFFRRRKIPRDKIKTNGLKEKDFTIMIDKDGTEYIRPLRLGRVAGLILLLLYFTYILCLFQFKGWAPWNFDPNKPSITPNTTIDK